MYTVAILGALASSAMAQAITFSNTTFTAPVRVGSTWPISFSAGNGEPVAIAFGNSTYAFQVVDGLSAPGTFNWKVAVPVNVVEGEYQLALVQEDSNALARRDSEPVYSPAFTLVIPPEDASSTTDAPTTDVAFPTTAVAKTTTTVTAIYLPYPSNATIINYIYYEDECACHKTTTCGVEALPTTPMSSTTVTYSATECGCTTTIEAPCAETVIPVAAAATTPMATNTPMAPSSAPAQPTVAAASPTMAAMPTSASPMATYTGGAEKVVSSGFGFFAMVAGLLLA